MADEPPRGSERVALEIGSMIRLPVRSVRVILDSAGNPVSFRDEIVYGDSSVAVAVRFDKGGAVAEGMEHHHVERDGVSSTTGDRALEPAKYALVLQAVRRLRVLCGT